VQPKEGISRADVPTAKDIGRKRGPHHHQSANHKKDRGITYGKKQKMEWKKK